MSNFLTLLILLTAALCRLAPAQSPQKPLAFEVVSIHPSKPGVNKGMYWQTQPDGYHVTGQSLRSTILMAWFPQGLAYWGPDRLKGGQSWLDDPYDIDARVSEADLAAWQNQGAALDQKPMLTAMLKAMLADRCKLAVHSVPGQIQGSTLELAPSGAKLTPTPPDEKLPPGFPFPDGATMVYKTREDKPLLNFYGAGMTDFVQYLSMQSMGHPVTDHTGLTGRFDFTLAWLSTDPDERPGITESSDPDPLAHWNFAALGLRRQPAKLPADTLVIDHIEKPSEN